MLWPSSHALGFGTYISQHAKKHLSKVNDTNRVTTATMEFERTTQRITANTLAGTQKRGKANALQGDNSLHLGL